MKPEYSGDWPATGQFQVEVAVLAFFFFKNDMYSGRGIAKFAYVTTACVHQHVLTVCHWVMLICIDSTTACVHHSLCASTCIDCLFLMVSCECASTPRLCASTCLDCFSWCHGVMRMSDVCWQGDPATRAGLKFCTDWMGAGAGAGQHCLGKL